MTTIIDDQKGNPQKTELDAKGAESGPKQVEADIAKANIAKAEVAKPEVAKPRIHASLERGKKSGYYGAIEIISKDGIYGWIVNAGNLAETASIQILLGKDVIASVYGTGFRADLSELMQQPTYGGFHLKWKKANLPTSVKKSKDGETANLTFLLEDADFELVPLPKTKMPTIGEIRKWVGGGERAPLSGSQKKALVQKYEGQQVEPLRLEDEDVKLIAFYLPQYHPIPENDEWWGSGFTEWSNVTQAKPLFPGHHQPRVPANLGYYDLRLPEVREAQAKLAKEYGIHGFCYYYYWFAGRRILDRPLQEVLESGKPDFPFCICWANENWTRRWDGADADILLKQEHSLDNDIAFIHDVIPLLKDPRYIRVKGAPLLAVYRVELFPDPARTAELWRKICRDEGVGEIYLAGVESFGFADPYAAGFDASVEFPPLNEPPTPITDTIEDLDKEFTGGIYDYEEVVGRELNRPAPTHKRFRGIMCGWDNTPRRKKMSHIFDNANPENYEVWLRGLVDYTKENLPAGERLVFVNAWNEWAEGTYLEPDKKHGLGYLEATQRALNGNQPWRALLDYARKKGNLQGEALQNLLNDLEARFAGYERSLSFISKLYKGNAPLLTSKSVFSTLTPTLIQSNPVGISGQGNVERVNSTSWKADVVVPRDRFVYLSGWATAETAFLEQHTNSYMVLERIGGDKRWFYALIFGRVRRRDVTDALPDRPREETEYSGFVTYADIGNVPPGEYRLGMLIPVRDRLSLHFFDGGMTIV